MSFTVFGQDKARMEPVFGVEWGGATTILERYHRNFMAEAGYRVDEKGSVMSLKTTGSLTAKAGIRFNEHYTATVNTGIMGVRQQRSAVPITARFSYNFKNYEQNGLMCFLEAGAIYPNRYYANFITESGVGYRIGLSHRFSLDFMLTFRVCADERKITDPDTGADVDIWNIKKNNSTFFATGYKIGINF